MPEATNGSIRLHYGWLAPKGVPVILLAGAGRPSTDFDVLFCDPLIARGFRPLRIDSRDTGRSTAMTGVSANLHAVRDAALGLDGGPPPYRVADMVDDVIAVMAHAGIDRAHLVGRSLGALVAQQLAIIAPERVASLNLVMAMSRSMADHISDAALDRLEHERIDGEEDYVGRQRAVAAANALEQDRDDSRIVAEARIAWARGIHPGGTARHFAASLALPDLRPALRQLEIPTLILHGRADRMIPLDRARETAAAIPGAVLDVIEDMAHDGPPRLRALWGERIAGHLSSLEDWISHM